MKKSIKEILSAKGLKEVEATGWIRTKRDSKNVIFIELNDGTVHKGLQVVIDKQSFKKLAEIELMNTGASASFTGKLVKSQGANQAVEMQAVDCKLYGIADSTYPMQKKRQTLEFLRDLNHLRPRTNTISAVMRIRSLAAYAVHKFFQEEMGFYYLNTPLITTSDCEGAGEMFAVTTLNLEKVPKLKSGEVDYSQDFFSKRAYLTVSGQLEGESYATAIRNIYTFGPTFRAEKSATTRHLAEFWMIEPEMAFYDLNDNAELAEKFLKYVLKYVLDNADEDMQFFDKFIQPGVCDMLKGVIDKPFARITYTDAIKELEKNNKKFEYPVKWGSDIQTEHERFITETICSAPSIVTDYPKEIKSFYMKQNSDGKTVRAMDVLVPRLGEIIGGSEREENYDKLLLRINELGLDPESYKWYLDLRKYGTVPHSGFGLGFERLVLYITGMQNIRDVIPYPRSYHHS